MFFFLNLFVQLFLNKNDKHGLNLAGVLAIWYDEIDCFFITSSAQIHKF